MQKLLLKYYKNMQTSNQIAETHAAYICCLLFVKKKQKKEKKEVRQGLNKEKENYHYPRSQ